MNTGEKSNLTRAAHNVLAVYPWIILSFLLPVLIGTGIIMAVIACLTSLATEQLVDLAIGVAAIHVPILVGFFIWREQQLRGHDF